jgi:hypothetical protein
MLVGSVAALLRLSTICTEKLNVPDVVGVPDMMPVEAAKARPGGKLPALTDQTTGAVQLFVPMVNGL